MITTFIHLQVNLLEYVLDAVGDASKDPKIFARLVTAQVSEEQTLYCATNTAQY